MGTTFHPQTNKQTKKQNQILKQYLQIFCHHWQDDWAEFLSQAEFVINNALSALTKKLLFYLLHGYHPKCDWVHEMRELLTDSVKVLWTDEQARDLNQLQEGMAVEWKCVSETQAMMYNCKHQPMTYKVGDHIWLSTRNLNQQRLNKKLLNKYVDSYTVLSLIKRQTYWLNLRNSTKHDIFHVLLLKPVKGYP